MKTNVYALAVLCGVSGCATQSPENSASSASVTAPASVVVATPAKPAPIVVAPATKPPSREAATDLLNDPKSLLSKHSVYYEFDQATIQPEFRPIVEAHAQYLRQHAGAAVRIEGNCDEEGSREYNLALGQRRAESVLKAMTLMGVPAMQIETVSWGEEKPKAAGHDESSWSQNRRSDIVYGKMR